MTRRDSHRHSSRAALRRANAGLSLIEVMVALAISAILLFGLSQIFIGSKNVYRLQEGMSRVQENSRFVLQYLESNVRMAGYMGCGNDVDLTAKSGSPPAFLNHLAQMSSTLGVPPIVQDTLTSAQRFQRPIEGYAYTGGGFDGLDPAVGAAGDWEPNLQTPEPLGLFASLDTTPIKGSDVLVLRLINADSTAVVGNFNMDAGTFRVADPSLVRAGNIYAITNCANARIFKATSIDTGTGLVTANATDNLLRLTTNPNSTWTGSYANMQFNQIGTALNAEVHQADYLVLFVGLRGDVPVLKALTGPPGALVAQEIADGVEAMRVQFGVDTDADGNVDKYVPANNTEADSNLAVANKTQRDIAWRKVLSVRIALLVRSADRASESAHTGAATEDNVFYLFDTAVQRPKDSRFRDVYTTTISLRNRLGNY
ncbi:MAG: PilW family protein [Rhodanobacteraceae bacterium]